LSLFYEPPTLLWKLANQQKVVYTGRATMLPGRRRLGNAGRNPKHVSTERSWIGAGGFGAGTERWVD